MDKKILCKMKNNRNQDGMVFSRLKNVLHSSYKKPESKKIVDEEKEDDQKDSKKENGNSGIVTEFIKNIKERKKNKSKQKHTQKSFDEDQKIAPQTKRSTQSIQAKQQKSLPQQSLAQEQKSQTKQQQKTMGAGPLSKFGLKISGNETADLIGTICFGIAGASILTIVIMAILITIFSIMIPELAFTLLGILSLSTIIAGAVSLVVPKIQCTLKSIINRPSNFIGNKLLKDKSNSIAQNRYIKPPNIITTKLSAQQNNLNNNEMKKLIKKQQHTKLKTKSDNKLKNIINHHKFSEIEKNRQLIRQSTNKTIDV